MCLPRVMRPSVQILTPHPQKALYYNDFPRYSETQGDTNHQVTSQVDRCILQNSGLCDMHSTMDEKHLTPAQPPQFSDWLIDMNRWFCWTNVFCWRLLNDASITINIFNYFFLFAWFSIWEYCSTNSREKYNSHIHVYGVNTIYVSTKLEQL